MSTTTTPRPLLQGVIFDMDGTLTVPNLNFTEMYSRCNVPMDQDILKAIAEMEPSDAKKASDIIGEMEEEGRNTLKLNPGAVEVGKWLNKHNIPISLVTRNTRKTVDVMVNKLWYPQTKTKFDPSLSRDDCGDLPAKPHPASIFEIQKQWGFLKNEDILKEKGATFKHAELGLLMVGDSPKHDIQFGKDAGVSTALLDTEKKLVDEDKRNEPDIYVTSMIQLPRKLWNTFEIYSPLGHNSPLLKYKKPEATTRAGIAAVAGDIDALSKMSNDELRSPDESGNTPLIWATDANHLDVVKYLIDKKDCYGVEDINLCGYIGATAVCRASRSGHIDILKYLIDIGKADMNIPNSKMQYPLHFAAFKKKSEAVITLLERGANTLVLDRKGRTPAEDTSDMNIKATILKARTKIYGDSLV